MNGSSNRSIAIARIFRRFNPVSAIVITVGGFIVANFVGAVVYIFIISVMGLDMNEAKRFQDNVLVNFALSVVVYLSYLFIIKKFLNFNKLSLKSIGLKWTKVKWDTLLYIVGGFSVYFICFLVITTLLKGVLPEEVFKQKQELGFETSTTGINLVAVFISLVLLPAVVEEVAMRGFLYTGLRKKLNFWWSGLIVAVIFGVAHLQFGSGAPLLWIAAIDTFILSWVLVYIREKSDSIYPTIGIHALKNFFVFLALFVFHIA
ncbi:MAG: CPBP family intramembrane glutamic endopeptidase [Candidatus Saccharimonadales bacterium]